MVITPTQQYHDEKLIRNIQGYGKDACGTAIEQRRRSHRQLLMEIDYENYNETSMCGFVGFPAGC